MKVIVEWLDGETREYKKVTSASDGGDGVLHLRTEVYYGRSDPMADIPLAGVREWKQVED